MAEQKPVQPKQKTGLITKLQKRFTGQYEKEQSRKKAFTRWVNWKLSTRDPPRQVTDLIREIQDGELLFDLLEVLVGHSLETARNEQQEPQQKVKKALHVLYMNGFHITTISTEDILAGNETAILKLMWRIILQSQVSDTKGTDQAKTTKTQRAESKLLKWCQERAKSYKRVKISDFSLSWKDGLALNALLHSYKPKLFPFQGLYEQTPKERLQYAFLRASETFDMPHLLEANDVAVDKPDRALIMMYTGALYSHFEGSTPDQHEQVATLDVPNTGGANSESAETKGPQEQEEVEEEVKEEEILETRKDNAHQDVKDAAEGLSSPEGETAVKELREKLKEVEQKIEEAEKRRPYYNKDRSAHTLEICRGKLEQHQEDERALGPLKSQVIDTLNEGQRLIGAGILQGEEKEVGKRLESIDHKMNELLNRMKHHKEQLLKTFEALLKQHMEQLSQWAKKGEEKMKLESSKTDAKDRGKSYGGDLKSVSKDEYDGYEEVKKEIASHQKFQDQLPDVSFIKSELDGENPNISKETREELRKTDSQWKNVWDWCENEQARLTMLLGSWKEFQESSVAILDWLERSLSLFHKVAEVDVADEKKVNKELEMLEATQRELEEQDLRLKKLQQHGKKLIEVYKPASPAAKTVSARQLVLNKCWEEAGKKVLTWREWLITSRKKMKELQEYMDSVNEWIDEAETAMSEYNDDISKEEKTKIMDKVEIKCEERPATEKKVERINRLGEDLLESLRGPRSAALRADMHHLKEHWQDVTAALESFSDKGYPEQNKECCPLQIFRRKALA